MKLLYFNLKNNGLNFNQSHQSFKCAVNKALKYNGLNLPVISIIVSVLVFLEIHMLFRRPMLVFEFQLVSVIVSYRVALFLKREMDLISALLKDLI